MYYNVEIFLHATIFLNDLSHEKHTQLYINYHYNLLLIKSQIYILIISVLKIII